MMQQLHTGARLFTATLMIVLFVGCSTTDPGQPSDDIEKTARGEIDQPEATATDGEPEPPDESTSPDDADSSNDADSPDDEEVSDDAGDTDDADSSSDADPSDDADSPDDEEVSDDAGDTDDADSPDDEKASDDVDDTEKRATEALEEEFPDFFRISSPTHIEEWIFFKVTDTRLSHPSPSCEVVRKDMTRVTDDQSGELLTIYRAMGVFDGDLSSDYDMAIAANALIGDCRGVLSSAGARGRNDDFSDIDVTAPRAERDGDTFTLIYFSIGSDYRNKSVYRGEVVFTADELVDADIETFIPDDADDEQDGELVDPFR